MKNTIPLNNLKQTLYLGILWVPIYLVVVFIHKSSTEANWIQSAILLLPPMIIKLFMCFGTRFICKSNPIKFQTLFKVVFSHFLGAVIISGTWIFLIMAYSNLLESITGNPEWKVLFETSLPLFAGISFSLYIISVLFHYLIIANQAARKAEHEALNQRLYASQAELKVLKSTIQPHFLFNSFNSIGPLINKSPSKAQHFVEQLSGFFRYSLKHGGEKTVLLKNELDHIKDYLGIEKIRFGDRLKLKFEIEQNTLEKPVLSLILLPLVENAIKHGINQCLEGGLLKISTCCDGDFIVISVENPWEQPSHPIKGEGMGIRTLQQRLQFYYGSPAKCLVNKTKKNFSVKLIIPCELETSNAT